MVPRKRVDDSRRVLPWALLLSLLTHAVMIPALLWFIVLHLIAPSMLHPVEDLAISASTAVTIAKKNNPSPPHQAKPEPVRQQHVVTATTPAPPPPHELAQIVRRSTITEPPQQPHKASLGSELAAQELAFAREARQLHAQNNPLSVATMSPKAPTTIQRSYFDDPAHAKRLQGFTAYLSSMQQWYDGNLSCHYAHYNTYMAGGGNDEGDIPWPVCYPRNHDLLSIQAYASIPLPVPYPPPGYVLPKNTYISDWLRDNVYNNRPH